MHPVWSKPVCMKLTKPLMSQRDANCAECSWKMDDTIILRAQFQDATTLCTRITPRSEPKGFRGTEAGAVCPNAILIHCARVVDKSLEMFERSFLNLHLLVVTLSEKRALQASWSACIYLTGCRATNLPLEG